MDELSWLVIQVVQPYFYYTLFFSIAAFFAINLVMRFVRIGDHRVRSSLFMVPLLIPLIIYALYPPNLDIPMIGDKMGDVLVNLPAGPDIYPMRPLFHPPEIVNLLSVSGTLCIAGLLIGVIVVTVGMVLTRRIHKNDEITFLNDDEYSDVRSMIATGCERLGIPEPRLGIIEDLRPNAFVGGTRGSSIIVFSLGMLDMFTKDELRAAIDHELTHLRNRDPIFRIMAAALTAISFFNPLAYLSYSSAMREREYMADESAMRSKKSKAALVSALRKSSMTCSQVEARAAMQGLNRLLFIPLFSRHMLSTHPCEGDRVASLDRANRERKLDAKKAVFAAACMLILAASMCALLIDARDQMVLDDIKAHINDAPDDARENDDPFLPRAWMAEDARMPLAMGPWHWSTGYHHLNSTIFTKSVG